MKNEFFTEKFYYTIATVFGVGYSPVMPGTAGTLAGLILCILLHQFTFIYILVFLGLFAAGVASSTRVEEDCAVKDPSFIVIDEAACIFAAFVALIINLHLDQHPDRRLAWSAIKFMITPNTRGIIPRRFHKGGMIRTTGYKK